MVTNQQQLAMIEEIRTSSRLLQIGLAEFNRIDGANDFYHLPFLLLVSGFERLMKCVICLYHLEKHGNYPTNKDIKKYGHNLEKLLEEIVRICKEENYSNQCKAAKQDVLFMEGDKDLHNIIRILSSFGEKLRYYNMDIITGKPPTGDDPEGQWQEFELKILQRQPGWADLVKNYKLDESYQKINKYLTTILARLSRGLCRLFTLGPISNFGKSLSAGSIEPFLFLKNDELGRTKWI